MRESGPAAAVKVTVATPDALSVIAVPLILVPLLKKSMLPVADDGVTVAVAVMD